MNTPAAADGSVNAAIRITLALRELDSLTEYLADLSENDDYIYLTDVLPFTQRIGALLFDLQAP